MSNDQIDVHAVQERLAQCRSVLEDLESGRLMTGVVCGAGWRHMTQRDIARKRREIAKYERMLGRGRRHC
jgi:hypothetical protein